MFATGDADGGEARESRGAPVVIPESAHRSAATLRISPTTDALQPSANAALQSAPSVVAWASIVRGAFANSAYAPDALPAQLASIAIRATDCVFSASSTNWCRLAPGLAWEPFPLVGGIRTRNNLVISEMLFH